MNLSLSPLTSRIVAVGLLILALLLLIQLLSALISTVQDVRLELGDVRARRAQLEQRIARGIPERGAIVPTDLFFRAKTEPEAAGVFGTYVNIVARRYGVQVRGLSVDPTSGIAGHALDATIQVDGPETSVIKFVSELEQGRKLTRLVAWHITKGQDLKAGISLSGHVVAAWGPHP